MKKSIMAMAATVIFLPVCAGVAQAAEVAVKNCTDGGLAVYSFDSGDKGCEHEVDELDMSAGEMGKIICGSDKSCQVALDFVGGQWAYFKCPAIEPKRVDEDDVLVVCSATKKSNGFMIADESHVIPVEEGRSDCLKLCSK